MSFPILNRRFGAVGIALSILLSLAVFSCNLSSEAGHTFLIIKKDSAWDRFSQIEISWKDAGTGQGALLFHGPPQNLTAINKFSADGYRGQKIDISIKGYLAGKLAYEEKRGFDGANPGTVTQEIIPIDTTTGIPPIVKPVISGFPALSPIRADTIISIHDSVAFTADVSIDSGSLKSYAWDYTGKGGFGPAIAIAGKSLRITGGFRYAAEGEYRVTLQVASQTDSLTRSHVDVKVRRDTPAADAGEDVTIYLNAPVTLRGKADDSLGEIVKTEWKIGAAPFVTASLDTTFLAPATAQDIEAVLRITDDDGLFDLDTVFIHVISPTESNLTGIMVSDGLLSPQFDPAIPTYVDTVAFEIRAITVTPTGNGTIKVNGAPVVSGQASLSIDLPAGSVTSVRISTQSAGALEKDYTVAVFRKPASSDAGLKSLVISAGALNKAFLPGDTAYSVSAANATATTTVTATVSNAGSTMKVNGVSVESGIVSGSIDLAVGSNPLTVIVTSQSGATKTYLVTVQRGGDLNADLTALSLSAGAIKGPGGGFAPGDISYTLEVPNSVSSTSVTATLSSPTSTLTINSHAAASGLPSSVFLAVGLNTVTITVSAQAGGTKSYTVKVTRAPNDDANLSALEIFSEASSPLPFNPATTAYTATVSNVTTSIKVTATTSAYTSTLVIKGSAANSGFPSATITLAVGANTIPVVVTAQSGVTKTYTLTVTRTGDGDATLSSLVTSAGSLAPAPFNSSILLCSTFVANGITSTTVTATVSALTSTVTVAGKPAVSGTATSAIALIPGYNDIPVQVTAQDGSFTTYTVRINRARKVIAISCGQANNVVLREDGTVFDWGWASGTNSPRPQGLSGVKAIATGWVHIIALKTDGTVVTWGGGDNTAGIDATTVPAGLSAVKAIAAGTLTSFAVKTNGTVVAWGDTVYGQLSKPRSMTGVDSIITGQNSRTGFIVKGNTYTFFGEGSGGPIETGPAGLTGIKTLSVGGDLVVALKTDGTVAAWSNNNPSVPAEVPSGLSGVKAIAVGGSHVLALKTDGTVVGWGSNEVGQATPPSGLTGVVAIAAGYANSMALKSDGTLVAWGGELGGSGLNTVPIEAYR